MVGNAVRAAGLAALLAFAPAVPAWADYEAGQRAWDAGKTEAAVSEWRAAAGAGDRRAMLALGRLHLKGLGVLQDYVEAHKWLNLAASRGEAAALEERDALSAKMTPAQVAAAQDLARNWRPGGSGAGEAPVPAPKEEAAEKKAPDPGPPPPRAIGEAQRLLATLGYKPGPADGAWGDRTEKAYRTFLADAGLPAAEALTPEALRALRAAAKRSGGSAESVTAPSRPAGRSTALHRAAAAGDIDGLEAALAGGADPNARDERGRTALMLAADKGYTLLLPPLLEAGADTDIRAADGATALFMAVVQGHGEAAGLLLDAGADIAVEGPKSQTAMDVAKLRKDDETVELLWKIQVDDKAFAKAKAGKSGKSYADYLATYPTGRHADDAAFARAEWVGTGPAYKAYMALYPEGKHRPAARAKSSGTGPDIEPKCEDLPGEWLEGNHAECWQEITRLPGCYHWTDHYHSDRSTRNWSGGCEGGIADGPGELFTQIGSGHSWSKGKGKFANGKRHGRWSFRAGDGTYEGSYKDGEMHGSWSYRWGGGKREEGPFVNGKRHGKWITRFPDDGRFEIEWRNGSREGQPGVYIDEDGDRHPGRWSGNCFRDGEGHAWIASDWDKCPND